jgi:hypothetical protein
MTTTYLSSAADDAPLVNDVSGQYLKEDVKLTVGQSVELGALQSCNALAQSAVDNVPRFVAQARLNHFVTVVVFLAPPNDAAVSFLRFFSVVIALLT